MAKALDLIKHILKLSRDHIYQAINPHLIYLFSIISLISTRYWAFAITQFVYKKMYLGYRKQ